MTDSLVRAAEIISTVLFNAVWQGALIGGAAWLVLRTAKSASATTRHAVLVAALVAAIALPLATTVAAVALRPQTHALSLTAERAGAIVAGRPPARAAHTSARPAINTAQPTATTARGVAAWFSLPERPSMALPAGVLLAIAGLWLAGALFLVARLAFSLFYLERLKRDALPLTVSSREHLERWTTVGKGSRDVRLCRSSEIATPIAVGIFDAMILIPDRLIEELSPDDLDRIILHELAHLRRGDDWSNAFERVAEAVMFFNPAVRWVVRQLDLEREVACDDWVLERRGEAVPYAQCLVRLVEDTAWPHNALAAPGVFVTRRSVSIRIERLLARHRDVRLRVAPGPLAAVAGVGAAACALGLFVSPSIASSAAAVSNGSIARVPVAPSVATVRAAAPLRTHPHAAAAVTAKQPRSVALAANATAPLATAPPAPPVKPASIGPQKPAVRRTPATVTAATPGATEHGGSVLAAGASPGSATTLERSDFTEPMSNDYISEISGAGYPNLSVDDLIRLRAVGVTGEYIRAIQAAGFGHPSVDDLVRLRSVGVTPDYIKDMRKTFPSVTSDDLLRLRALGVTPAYVADLRAAGVRPIGPDDAARMKSVGVDPAYVRLLAANGYATVDSDTLMRLRAIGIDAKFFDAVKAHGWHGLTLDQLIRLKTSGVME